MPEKVILLGHLGESCEAYNPLSSPYGTWVLPVLPSSPSFGCDALAEAVPIKGHKYVEEKEGKEAALPLAPPTFAGLLAHCLGWFLCRLILN